MACTREYCLFEMTDSFSYLTNIPFFRPFSPLKGTNWIEKFDFLPFRFIITIRCGYTTEHGEVSGVKV